MLALALGSYAATTTAIHRRNHFEFGPIVEVAVLFAGIFATMAPVLLALNQNATSLGLATPWQFVRDHLTIAEPAGSYELGLSYRLRYANGALDLQADDLSFRMKDVAIAQQEGGATLGRLATIAFEDSASGSEKTIGSPTSVASRRAGSRGTCPSSGAPISSARVSPPPEPKIVSPEPTR